MDKTTEIYRKQKSLLLSNLVKDFNFWNEIDNEQAKEIADAYQKLIFLFTQPDKK